MTGALAGGIISENDVLSSAESGIYLSVGCLNVVVQSNKLVGCGNNGILMINSRYCHVINNTIDECWNCGIQIWNSSEVSIQSNSVRDCGFSLHNALGLLGDCWASGVTLAGNTSIAVDAEFQARIFSNIFLQLHPTRSASKIAILVTNNAYSSGDEIYISGNAVSDDVALKVKIDPSAVGQDPTVKDLLPVDFDTLYPLSVADGQLTIAKTNGLQTALDAKQATLEDDSVTQYMVQNLPIAKITGLQTAIDAKQNAALGDMPHLSSLDETFGSLAAISAKVFEINNNKRGYFDISINTSISAGSWFDLQIDSDDINFANVSGLFLDTLILVPDTQSYLIIDQRRSMNNSGVMIKRMYLEYDTATSGVFARVCFRVRQ